VLAAHGPEELRGHLGRLLERPEAAPEYVAALRQVLTDSFGEADGDSGVRLAALCAQLAGVGEHAAAG